MQTVLILGGSSGIGLRLAVDYLSRGAKVYATYRTNPKPLLYLKKRFPDLIPVFLDLAQASTFRIDDPLDVVIFAAGTIHSRLLLSESADHFREMIQTDLTSHAQICQTIHPCLTSSSNAHILFISSRSALSGNIGQVTYSACKAGLVGLALSLAKEWASDKIKVNVILPGFMRSKQTVTLSQDIHARYSEGNLLKRYNTLSEISRFIRFLTSTRNISGQTFSLDSRVN